MKKYIHKSFKGTDAMVEWPNGTNIQPKQIVAVSFRDDWVTVVWYEEKEKKNG